MTDQFVWWGSLIISLGVGFILGAGFILWCEGGR